jgi:hypothetical protein
VGSRLSTYEGRNELERKRTGAQEGIMASIDSIEAASEMTNDELAEVAGARHWMLTSDCGGGTYVQVSDGCRGFSATLSTSRSDGGVTSSLQVSLPRGWGGSLSIHEPGLDFALSGRIG